jgi:hypothetical protein
MIIVVVVSFSTKSHTHEEGGGMSNLPTSGVCLTWFPMQWNRRQKVTKPWLVHTPLALVLLLLSLYPIASQNFSEAAYTSVFVFGSCRSIEKEEGKRQPSSHHAPSRSVRKKIRQPVDNNSNNREEEDRINKNKKVTKKSKRRRKRQEEKKRQRTRKGKDLPR